MNLRTTVAQILTAAAVTVGALAVSTGPAAAAPVHDAAAVSFAVLDAAGTPRGSVDSTPHLVTVCDRLADDVTVAVEFTFADGTGARRIAPLGGCNSAFPYGGSPIASVRGVAGDVAGAWIPVG
jgi:hypothetical protein